MIRDLMQQILNQQELVIMLSAHVTSEDYRKDLGGESHVEHIFDWRVIQL